MAASPTSSATYPIGGQSPPWDVSKGASSNFYDLDGGDQLLTLPGPSNTFGDQTPYWVTPEFDSALGTMLQHQSGSHGQHELNDMLSLPPFGIWDSTPLPMMPGMVPDNLISNASPYTTSIALPNGLSSNVSPHTTSTTLLGPHTVSLTSLPALPVIPLTTPTASLASLPALPIIPLTTPTALVTNVALKIGGRQ
jgi:hypothetical protein